MIDQKVKQMQHFIENKHGEQQPTNQPTNQPTKNTHIMQQKKGCLKSFQCLLRSGWETCSASANGIKDEGRGPYLDVPLEVRISG